MRAIPRRPDPGKKTVEYAAKQRVAVVNSEAFRADLERKSTARELAVRERLLEYDVEFETHYPLGNRFIVDVFVARDSLVIEVDGGSHEIPDRVIRDTELDRYCHDNRLVIVRVN
jgi:very-short-patch-repair endonuclease